MQILGTTIHHPLEIEGTAGSSLGFGFLDSETTLETKKQLTRVSGNLTREDAGVSGYEIHAGTSGGPALSSPFASIDNRPDFALIVKHLYSFHGASQKFGVTDERFLLGYRRSYLTRNRKHA